MCIWKRKLDRGTVVRTTAKLTWALRVSVNKAYLDVLQFTRTDCCCEGIFGDSLGCCIVVKKVVPGVRGVPNARLPSIFYRPHLLRIRALYEHLPSNLGASACGEIR